MNILMISVFEGDIPPARYGGVERVVTWQIDELQKRGHDVTLVCREGSTQDCEKITYSPHNKISVIKDVVDAGLDKYDMVHEHGQSYMVKDFQNYIWTNSDSGENLFNKFRNKVHHNQAQALAEGLPDFAYAHIGMPADDILFDEDKDDYVAWTSCISHRHGADIAVEACRRAGVKLVFINDLALNYGGYDEFVKPNLDVAELFNLSDYSPEIAEIKKQQMVSKAKALIAPARDTTFGIVIIEAMAAGTPAIVGVSDDPLMLPPKEIIEDQLTGYACKNMDEYVEAIKSVDRLSPVACAERVEEKFTVEKMMDKYLELYERVRKGETW